MKDQANTDQASNLELDSLRRRVAILEQREADFRFLAENMGDVVFIVDMELRTTYVSPSIERILGYTPAERITQKVAEQLTPQSQKLVFEVLAEELALEKTAGADKNRSRTLELEYYHKDGSIKCLETYIRGARDSEGTLTGFYSLSRDITERKQAEEALRKSEKRFRAISDYTYNWENWLGTDGKLIWVNNAVLPFTGYSIDECFAMTDFPLPLVDEGDHEKFRQYFSLALQGSRYENIEFRIRCKDGSVKWAMLSWQPIYDSDGVSMGHRSSVRDITDRKRAEEALIASEEQYRSFSKMMRLMCDNVPDMIWAKDLERRFIFTNRAVCRLLLNAADTDEPVGKTDMFFVKRERESHPDNPQWHTFGEICIDSDKVVTESRKQAQFDEFGNVNGKFLFLDVQKAPFLDENGEMIGTVGCGRDVTAARESADKYRLLAEKMHDVVWIMDLELRWTYVSPSIELLLGFTPEERMSQKLLEHITPASLSTLRETFTREMEYEQQGQADPERVITLELEQYHKNGSTRWVETLISGIRNEQGVLTGLHGVSRDITERKQAEEAIQKSEALLRAVFDSVQDFIFIKDRNRRYLIINSFFQKRFHVDPSVFHGHTDEEVPIFENKDKTGAIIKNTDALVLQGETAHYELTHCVCGRLITFDIMKTPIRDGQGNITGICGLSRDITER
ncbi:MAG: PAS domain S-box protein, partial [Syntrophus sp. (in: bacteria)]